MLPWVASIQDRMVTALHSLLMVLVQVVLEDPLSYLMDPPSVAHQAMDLQRPTVLLPALPALQVRAVSIQTVCVW